MLTVEKLVKTIEYEENRKKEMQERRNKLIFDLPIFKDIKNENEWNIKKEEIKKQKEISMKNNRQELEKKENKLRKNIENEKKERLMKIPILNDIKNENEWRRQRRKLYIERITVQNNRMMSKEQRKEITNKELHKKVLEYKDQLQSHHNERIEKHIQHINKDKDNQDKYNKLIEWYEKEKEEQLKRLHKREEMNAIRLQKNELNSKMLEWYEKEKEEQLKRLHKREEMNETNKL
jgi:hypothetical protein